MEEIARSRHSASTPRTHDLSPRPHNMMLNKTEFDWLLEEASPLIELSAIQKIWEFGPRQRILQLRRPGRTLMLCVDTSTTSGRAHLTSIKGTRPPHPSTFTMSLRKWVGGMIIREVSVTQNDRILTLLGDAVPPDWEAPEDHDGPAPREHREVVIELLGRHTNIFILGPDRRILGQENRDTLPNREAKTHATYTPPPQQADHEPRALRWPELASDPALADAPRNATAAKWFTARAEETAFTSLQVLLGKRLTRARKKTRRLVRKIEQDLARAQDAREWRKFGELLQSAHGKIDRGASIAKVPDYYQEGMPTVEIPLDPALSLKANIDKYFKQYKRLNNAIARIEERLINMMETQEELEDARIRLGHQETLPQLEAFAKDLITRKLLPRDALEPTRQKQQRHKQAKKLPYRKFRALGGSVIIVGRGAKANDEVSTHVARGRDIWLHARDWSGAHVLLRMPKDKNTPNQQELHDAATLAAHFSRGKQDSLIDVTYTHAKYVRKPKGYPVGMVTVAGGSTIGVSIDQSRLERLLATEE